MGIKSTHFLLAFVLLATIMASSYADVDATENEHHHHHHHRHRHHSKAPAKAPGHAPAKAPAHAPAKAPVHAPTKAPVHPPVHPPVFHHTHFCVAKCETHCKAMSPKNWCMKACSACCAKFKCVPDGSNHYCKNWDGVVIRGKAVKCPRRN